MIATIYKLPSWWTNQDNKPTLQVFNNYVNKANSITLNAETINEPTLEDIEVQSEITIENWTQYNYIKFNNLWYRIINITYIQNTNNTVQITGKIDVYLSFVISFFDEANNNNETLVYFHQKHLNRWMYNSSNNNSLYVDFSAQFYLKNKHKALTNAGQHLIKSSDIANPSFYLQNTTSSFGNYSSTGFNCYTDYFLNNQNIYSYAYVLWNMTANETNQNMNLNGLCWNGLINIAYSPAGNDTMAWWQLLQHAPGDAYLDIIILPLPIEYSQPWFYYNAGSLNLLTSLNEYAPNTYNGSTNFNVIVGNPGIFCYVFDNNSLNLTNNYVLFNNIFTLDPYILNYCNFRCRGAGEDAFSDITMFNNVTPNTFIQTYYSFQLNLNHPSVQITNINYSYLGTLATITDYMIPYGYNYTNDAYYVLNWKAIWPSASNNWNNYLLNNLNNYHMGLNISHFKLQEAQANIGLGIARSVADLATGGDWMADLDSDNLGNAVNNGLEALQSAVDSGFNASCQNANYTYLQYGKKADMSRAANERLATGNSANSYQNYLLTFIFEYPVPFECQTMYNYCLLNGYVLERWVPWKYWYNRTNCNYIKCGYFSDAMMPYLNQKYKNIIDTLFNVGFRVWTSANTNLDTVPFSNILSSVDTNMELNINNNEIDYLRML